MHIWSQEMQKGRLFSRLIFIHDRILSKQQSIELWLLEFLKIPHIKGLRQSCKKSICRYNRRMFEIGEKLLELVCLLLRLPKAGGAFGLVAEVLLLRQQLLVLTRGKKKCPALKSTDRLIMGLCTLVMTPKRIGKSAIAIAASTLLDFHRALVTRKYSRLFSKRSASKPGPKGPSKELIKLVVETKEGNPLYGARESLCSWATCLALQLTKKPLEEF